MCHCTYSKSNSKEAKYGGRMIVFTAQEERIISLLQTKSKRAIQRIARPFGRPYKYRPRYDLCLRIALETGLTVEEAQDSLIAIHAKIKRENGAVIL